MNLCLYRLTRHAQLTRWCCWLLASSPDALSEFLHQAVATSSPAKTWGASGSTSDDFEHMVTVYSKLSKHEAPRRVPFVASLGSTHLGLPYFDPMILSESFRSVHLLNNNPLKCVSLLGQCMRSSGFSPLETGWWSQLTHADSCRPTSPEDASSFGPCHGTCCRELTTHWPHMLCQDGNVKMGYDGRWLGIDQDDFGLRMLKANLSKRRKNHSLDRLAWKTLFRSFLQWIRAFQGSWSCIRARRASGWLAAGAPSTSANQMVSKWGKSFPKLRWSSQLGSF